MILVNGKDSDSNLVSDRALHYGDGLFETMRVVSGRIPHWEYHWQRLMSGCEKLFLQKPDRQQLEAEIQALASEEDQSVLKLIYTRGSGARGYRIGTQPPSRILIKYDMPMRDETKRTQGVNLRVCHLILSEQPALAGVKHLNRLENILARQEWSAPDIFEGLLQTASGHVIEGTMSNIFAVAQGKLITPVLDRCGVAGITRQRILDYAQQTQMPLEIRQLALEELYRADELFICNTVIGVLPVRALETLKFAVEDFTLTPQLQQVIDQHE